MNVQDKVNELVADHEFVESLKNVHSIEEISTIFEEKGVSLSPEEVKQALSLAEEHESSELSEDALDTVAAGGFIGGAILIAAGVLCAIGAVRGFIDAVNNHYR